MNTNTSYGEKMLDILLLKIFFKSILFLHMDVPRYPEQVLWRAVILQYIKELGHARYKIRYLSNGNLDNLTYDLNRLLRELDNGWFEEICDYANLDWYRLKKACYDIASGESELFLSKQHETYYKNL